MTIVLPNDAKNARKKARKLRTIQRPRGVEGSYRVALNKIVDAQKDALEPVNDLLAAGATASVASNLIEQQFQQTSASIQTGAAGVANTFVNKSNRVNKKSIESIYKSAFSVDSATIIDQPNVKDALDASLIENVSLIRSIHSDFWGDVIQAVTANFRGVAQVDNVSLQKRLQTIGGISSNKAKIIARDQTKKVSTSLTRIRHQNAGVKKYIWHNLQDQRVVGNPSGLYPHGHAIHLNHWAREGKIFYYDRPPADGNPGTAILCRCYEEPILDLDNANVIIS